MLDKYNWNSISFENIFPVCVCEQDLGKRKHAFGETKFYQLGMKFEGETIIHYNKESYTYSAGDVLYLPRESKTDVPYNKVFIQSGSGMCIFFDSVSSLCDKPMLFKKCDRSVQMLFQQIYTAYCRSNTLKTYSLFYEILAAINDGWNGTYKLEVATKYIDKHINDPFIDLHVLAQGCGVSEDYFRHIFKEIYGRSVLQYIAEQKIKNIKNALLTNNENIKEISCKCGFNDENYFSRFFKKHTGLTPSEFRKKYSSGSI